MDRGAWLGTVHRVTKSQMQLKGLSTGAFLEFLAFSMTQQMLVI